MFCRIHFREPNSIEIGRPCAWLPDTCTALQKARGCSCAKETWMAVSTEETEGAEAGNLQNENIMAP